MPFAQSIEIPVKPLGSQRLLGQPGAMLVLVGGTGLYLLPVIAAVASGAGALILAVSALIAGAGWITVSRFRWQLWSMLGRKECLSAPSQVVMHADDQFALRWLSHGLTDADDAVAFDVHPGSVRDQVVECTGVSVNRFWIVFNFFIPDARQARAVLPGRQGVRRSVWVTPGSLGTARYHQLAVRLRYRLNNINQADYR